MNRTPTETWKIRTQILAGFWGALYAANSLLLADVAILRDMESNLKDFLVMLATPRSSVAIPRNSESVVQMQQQVVLVDLTAFKGMNFKSYGLDDPSVYAQVLGNMTSAKGVLVNIPSTFTETANQENSAIKALLQDKPGKFVLVATPYLALSGKVILRSFFSGPEATPLPTSNAIDNRQGFFDFLPASFSSQPREFNKLNPTLQPYVAEREFWSSERAKKTYLSSVCLLIQKTSGSQSGCSEFLTSLKEPVLFKVGGDKGWGSRKIFERITIDDFCKPQPRVRCQPSLTPDVRKKINDKFLIVGLPPNDENLSRFPSSYGELSAMEMQANLLVSLSTGSLYKILGQEQSFAIILVGNAILLLLLSAVHPQTSQKALDLWVAIAVVCGLGYGGLVFLALFRFQLILPIVFPLVTWLLTSASVLLSPTVWRSLDRNAQQQQRFQEQAAVLSQTRKLLSRTATDIHDTSLQDLRLVMDRLEELIFDGKVDPDLLSLQRPFPMTLVEKLAHIGRNIRDHLNDMQTLAQKQHSISPELARGLDSGIQAWLSQLQANGALKLEVDAHQVEKLKEPDLAADSWLFRGDLSRFFQEASDREITWIDLREDIFRFFKEAIHNIIKHAQLTDPKATKIRITLKQQLEQRQQPDWNCQLVVENNGSPFIGPMPKGTGTKNMETIAAGLPCGSWQREFLDSGGVRVTLHWKMPSD